VIGRKQFFCEEKVTAQVWRSPPRKASGTGSGSFLKKRTKKLLQGQAEPLRKGRSQLSQSFLLLFFKKAGLPAACLTCGRLPGQLREKNQTTFANVRRAYPERPKPKQSKVFCFCFSKKKSFPS
jgi:hypothetical protein